MKLHRFTISLTRLLLAWTIIALTFTLGFFAGQKLDQSGSRVPTILPTANERPQETATSETIIATLPLEIVNVSGTKLVTQLSAGAHPRAYEGSATRTIELTRATKIYRVMFNAQGLPEVREVKSSALAIGQQIIISSSGDIATLATIQPTEIRILE